MTETISTERGFAEINGAQLYFEVAGAGHPLVMVHGHLLDSGQWDEQFALFAQRYRVVRYDARGFGQSSMPPETFAHHEDLRALLAFFGIERTYVMGCSGGGAASIDFALAYPEQTAALVLVGAGVIGYQSDKIPPLVQRVNEAFERGDIDQAVELVTQLWTDGTDRTPDQVNPAARERILAMTARLFARPKVDAPMNMLEPLAIGRLAEIQVPTLVVVGDRDLPRILDVADILLEQVPAARKLVIPDAAHHPNMEHPALFNQAVLDFLGALVD